MRSITGVLAAMEQEKLEQLADAADLLKEGDEADGEYKFHPKKYKIVPKRKGFGAMLTQGMEDDEKEALLSGLRITR
jgi:hypothetical protein